jgi:hypothetical protein
MTLLEQASLVLIPSGYKEDTVYSVVPSNGSGDMSFTRASDGTRINSAGLVEVVAWNLIQQSNSFSTSPWGLANSTLASGQTGYDGSTNAWRLNDNATNARHIIIQTPSVSGQVTFTIYAKANASNFLWIRGVQNSVEVNGWFNLSTGVLGTIETNGTGAIESVGDGWYKCSLTIANFENGFEFYVGLSNANAVLTYTGGSGSIFIQNSQLNIGSTAKPYFPTTDRLNVPRLTYQNGGGGCPSLLLEPQRTNVATYSEQFDNVAWSKLNATVTANNTTSPDGTQNADKFVENNGTGTKWIYNVPTVTSGSVYTYSVFAKKGERDFIYINAYSNGNFRAWFNLNTGTIGTTDIGATAKIENYGNGWYRCSVTFTASAGVQFYLLGVSNANNVENYTGNGTSGIYIWGAQNELGSYSTSYIPTTTASATRIADACSKTGISSLIGQTEGTIYAEIKVTQLLGALSRYIFHISDGTANNRIYMAFSGASSNILRGRIFNGGTLQCTIDTSTITTTGTYKLALGYKNNDIVFYLNGVQIGVDTSATIPACSRVDVGSNYASASQLSDGVSNAILYKTRLTNSELASLTTI